MSNVSYLPEVNTAEALVSDQLGNSKKVVVTAVELVAYENGRSKRPRAETGWSVKLAYVNYY